MSEEMKANNEKLQNEELSMEGLENTAGGGIHFFKMQSICSKCKKGFTSYNGATLCDSCRRMLY